MWQTILGEVIRDQQEKIQLADKLGVNVTTLDRWVKGQSEPRLHNVLSLAQFVSHASFLPALQEAFPELEERAEQAKAVSNLEEEIIIPSEFYRRVLNTIADTHVRLRFWSTCHLVLQQALGQLDPHRQGIAITIVQCMPPSMNGKIRSLRERIGVGTSPWGSDVEAKFMFLGLESLAGRVVSTGFPAVIQDMEDASIMFAHRVEHEESAAVYPLLQEGRIGGCLLVSSTQKQHFTPGRCALIRDYADLVALSFRPEDFYDWSLLELRVMPDITIQKSHLASFRQRLSALLLGVSHDHAPMTHEHAELVAWQQLEEAFVALSR